MGFNIGPEGGLVYRPWEAQAWKQTGIDPNLWNAPFAGGGLLGGQPTVVRTGGTGTGRTKTGTGGPMPDGTKTTADTGPTFHETFMAPGGGHEQALQRLYAAAGGDSTWGSYANWFNRTGGTPPSQGDGAVPSADVVGRSAGPGGRLITSPALGGAYQQDAPGMDTYSISPAMAGAVYDFPAVAPPIRPLTIGNLDQMQREAAASRRIAEQNFLNSQPQGLLPPTVRSTQDAAMAAAAANPMDFSPWGTPAGRQAYTPIDLR